MTKLGAPMPEVKLDWKIKARVLAYFALFLAGWLTLIHAVNLVGSGITQVFFLHSAVSETAGIVQSKLIPHLADPKHYSASEVANMYLMHAQITRDWLELIERSFFEAGIWAAVSLLIWVVVRWCFPDRERLIKIDLFPGMPQVLKRPIKFW